MDRRDFLRNAAVGVTLVTGVSRAALGQGGTASEDFCFCVAADPHCADAPKPDFEKYGTGLDCFMTAVREMEAMEGPDRPDFMLLLGDIHPQALEGRVKDIRIPVHATPGNHEATQETRELLRSFFPGDFRVNGIASDYYSFVHKGARFISVCDTGAGGDHVGHLCSEIIRPEGQCEWLEQELAAPEAVKVVFAHIPIERDGGDRNMYLGRNDSRWLRGLVEKTGPAAMFFGHLHHPTEEYAMGDTRVFQVRSCSWNFNKVPIGFLHVRVKGGQLEVREIQTGAAD